MANLKVAGLDIGANNLTIDVNGVLLVNGTEVLGSGGGSTIIDKPSIISPTDGATEFSGTVESSAFSSSLLYTGALDYVQWQVSDDAVFTNIVDNKIDTLDLIYTPNGVVNNTTYYVRVRHGSDSHISEWSDAISFTTPTSSIIINTPSITSPINAATDIDLAPTLTSSVYSVLGHSEPHLSSTWEIATDAGFTTIVNTSIDDLVNLTSYVVPSDLVSNTTYYARVKYKSTTYESDYSGVISFTTLNVQIATPTITSPTEGATEITVTPTTTSSVYSITNNIETHLSSTWEIATDIAFTNIVDTSVDDLVNLTSYSVPTLTANTTYYVRVKYKSASYESSYSTPVSFTTLSIEITKPTITAPTNSATGLSVTPTITSSVYGTLGHAEAHTTTDWQIATDAGFTTIVDSSLLDAINLTSYTTGTLNLNTDYYVRVRYNSATYTSEWSNTITFKTLVIEIAKPTITSPTAGEIDVELNRTITASVYSPTNHAEAHTSSDWQIATDIAFTNIVEQSIGDTVNKETYVASALSIDTVYYVRVRYNSATYTSEYSESVEFNTVNIIINKPAITLPLDGAVDQTTTPTIESDLYSTLNHSEPHLSSDWEISTNSNFTNIVYSSIANTSDLTSHNVSGLAESTVYYVRVRYNSTSYASEYSDASSFNTAGLVVYAPVITTPTNNATDVSLNLTVVVSSYNYNVVGETQESASYQVATDAGFTNLIVDNERDTVNLLSYALPVELSENTMYYIRVRHHSINNFTSAWTTHSFTTESGVLIDTPVISSPTQGAIVSLATPVTITASAYNIIVSQQEHLSTNWQIATDSGFATIIEESLSDTVNLTSYTPNNLIPSRVYYVRAMYNSESYSSQYTSNYSFSTAVVVISVPSITSHTNNQIDVALSPTFTTIAFSIFGIDETHVSTDWQLSTDNAFNQLNIVQESIDDTINLTSYTFSALDEGQTYYLRVRYKSQNYISEYSLLTITTLNVFISTPTLTVEGAPTTVPLNPILSTSAFNVVNGTDTHVSTDWVVEQGVTVIWSSLADTTNKTTITLPADTLVAGVSYTFKARHNGSIEGSSAYAEVSGTTLSAPSLPGFGEAFEGGFYAGSITRTDGTYAIIVSPKAEGQAPTTLTWRSVNTYTGAAGAARLNDGAANTAYIVSLGDATAFPAAHFCNDLTINGFSDWYLPAADELELLYRNLKPNTTNNRTDGRGFNATPFTDVPDINGDTHGINRHSDPIGTAYTSTVPSQTPATAFQVGGAEVIAPITQYIWSSTEGASGACSQTFNTASTNGYQNRQDARTDLHTVRAIRCVKL